MVHVNESGYGEGCSIRRPSFQRCPLRFVTSVRSPESAEIRPAL